MKSFYRLEKKLGKYAIKNLMSYIVFANAFVYILGLLNQQFINNLYFNPELVMQGQIWRVITFVFLPPDASIIFIIFALYINYMIGNSLEKVWGEFVFNCYYFLGMLGIIISAFITGYSMGNYYLSLSLFFAFAKLFPEFELLLFFVLPVKIKYLGYISWGFLIVSLITGDFATRIVILVSIINYFIFFGKDLFKRTKSIPKQAVRKKEYKDNFKKDKPYLHKCEICGKTDVDNPDLEFRFCSKCNGKHEYCMNHLFSHEHIK